MVVTIEINGVDLFPLKGVKVAFEKKFLDWKNLGIRKTHGTNAFYIAKSELEKVLGVISWYDNKIIRERIPAVLKYEGNPIDKGLLLIDAFDIKKQAYKVRFVSGMFDFWKFIDKKKLAEVEGLNDYNHGLSVANFDANKYNDTTKPFTYAVSEYGMIDNGVVVINYQLPAFFVAWLWQKVFDTAGYEVDVVPSDNEVITPTRGWDSVIDQTTEAWEKTVKGWQGDYCGKHYENVNGQYRMVYYRRLTWDEDGVHVGQGTFKITNSQNYRLRIQGTLKYGHDFMGYYIYRKDKNGNVELLDVYQPSQNGANTWDCNYDQTFTLSKDDEVMIYFRSDWDCSKADCAVGGYGDLYPDCTIDYTYCYYGYGYVKSTDAMDCPIGQRPDITFGTSTDNVAQVNLSSLMPDITIADFLREVMIRKAWYLDVNNWERKVKVRSIGDIFNRTGEHIRNFSVNSITYKPKGLAKKNWLKYQYTQNDMVDFADASLDIPDELLPEKTDLFVSTFRASVLGDTVVKEKDFHGLPTITEAIQRTPFWKAERDDDGNIKKWQKIGGKSFWLTLKRSVRANLTVKTYYGQAQDLNGFFWLARMEGIDFNTIIAERYDWFGKVYNDYVEIDVTIYDRFTFFQNFDLNAVHTFEGLPNRWICESIKWDGEFIKAKFIKVK